ncbi:TetR/AcrR family transcriptional regulator, partial [Streptomyces goshikiensis]
ASRTSVPGAVGSDAEVLAIRDADREELVAAIAEGAYGRREIPPIARLALVGWLAAVEGTTLEWIAAPADGADGVDGRAAPGRLRGRQVGPLGGTLTDIPEYLPACA